MLLNDQDRTVTYYAEFQVGRCCYTRVCVTNYLGKAVTNHAELTELLLLYDYKMIKIDAMNPTIFIFPVLIVPGSMNSFFNR